MKKDLDKIVMNKVNGLNRVFVAFGVMTCLCFIACNSTKTQIDERSRSGVVLILNTEYYTLTLPNGSVFYYLMRG